MYASAETAPGRRAVLVAVLGVLLLAFLPAVGTFTAPWIAEDAAILARVDADGPWVDWTRSQYGMRKLRFWRPVVSTSWAFQEATTGIAPAPLRLFNLASHALVACLALAAALRLGARPAGAFVAGAWIALFPEQGGTSTWLAGRTDLLCAAFLLASAVAALGPRPLASAPLAFLACASKEFGYLAPAWIGLLARARGASGREALRRAAPSAAAVALAFLWRRAALGGIAGAYPASLPDPATGLVNAARAVFAGAQESWLALALVAGAGLVARRAAPRALLWLLGAAALALVPLYPLLADGFLEPENRRLFYVPECALALAAGLAVAGRQSTARRRAPEIVLALVVAGALALRGVRAWQDTHDWARSAREGELAVARAREIVAGAEASEHPVLFRGFETSRYDAYCLGFGLAARFRAPFPSTPRPVWPWRLAFVDEGRRARAPAVAFRANGALWPRGDPGGAFRSFGPDGSLWPHDDGPMYAELVLRDAEGRPLHEIVLDERALFAAEDRSAPLTVTHASGLPYSGAQLEAVVCTELGYEPFPLGRLDEFGSATFTTMQLLVASNGVVAAADLLELLVDLGGRHAYVEFRALIPGYAPLAASRWIELVWGPELVAAVSAR